MHTRTKKKTKTKTKTKQNKTSLILTHANFETLFVLCRMFQDVSQQEIHCKTADSNGLVLGRKKINFTYSDRVCETF